MFFYILFFILCFGVALSIVVWSIRNGIAPMPTSPKAKLAWLKALPPQVSGSIYELGSGWGTLILPLAYRYPLATVTGFETSPAPYLFSRMACKGAKNVQLLRRNFFHADLSDAGLIICYLYPGAMRRLKDKFEKELKAGTWVISNTFAIPGWEPLQQIEVGDIYRTRIYVYRK